MQVFYAPDITGNEYILDEKESRHCIRVLRMGRNAPVKLIDGRGNLFEASIDNPDPGRCTVSVNRVIRDFEKRNYRLHLGISLLKNSDRFEWFIEKSVEIGIDEITPLICKNTEKPGFKRERLNNLIISAMKQSLKASLTILNEPATFGEFIRRNSDEIRMISHCNAGKTRYNIRDVYSPGQKALIVIGPEGDFTAIEIADAVDSGFRPVHLGSSRLRSETAGIAACHSIYFINQ